MRTNLAAVFFTVASICLPGMKANAGDLVEAQAALGSLLSDIETGRAHQVTVFFMKYERSTRTRVTPLALESQADKTVRPSLALMSEGLLRILKEMQLRQQEQTPDLRWGLIFSDASGNRLHSVYLDGRYIFGTGRRGYIDGILVGFDGSLSSWLEGEFLK